MRNRFLTFVVLLALFAQVVPLRALADEVSSEPAAREEVSTEPVVPESVVSTDVVTESSTPSEEPPIPTVATESDSTEAVVISPQEPVSTPVAAEEPALPPVDPAIVAEPDTSFEVVDEDLAVGPTIEEAAKDFTDIIPQTTEYTCGPAALATLILRKGGIAEEMRTAELAGTTEEKGTSMLGLKKAAQALGYSARVVRMSADQFKRAAPPFLAHDKKPDGSMHYSVIVSIDADTVAVADTDAGNIHMSVSDYAQIFTGEALMIEPMTRITDGLSDEGAINVIQNNPSLVSYVVDADGNRITIDQLSELTDEEADAVDGKFAQVVVLGGGMLIEYAITALGYTTISAAIAAAIVGTITVFTDGKKAFSSAIVGILYQFNATVRAAIDDAVDTLAESVPSSPGRCTPLPGGSGLASRIKEAIVHNKWNFIGNLTSLTGFRLAGFDAHHMLPQVFEDLFKKAGINIHDPKFGTWWQKNDHRQKAYDYNKQWEEFFRKNPNPTDCDILAFARELARKYHLDIWF